MSGGFFEYNQYRLNDIADQIDRLIENNDDKETGREYRAEIIAKFREASHTLKQAAEMVQRIDWLVSDDDGEESFLKRWEKQVPPYWQNSANNTTPPRATP